MRRLKQVAVSILEELRPSRLFPRASQRGFPPRFNRFGIPKIDGRYIKYEDYQRLAERSNKILKERQLEIDRLRRQLEIAQDRSPL